MGSPEMSSLTLLCVVDGSAPSCRAARLAAELASKGGTRLVFVSFGNGAKVTRDVETYLKMEGLVGEGWAGRPVLVDDAQYCLHLALSIASNVGVEDAEEMVMLGEPYHGIVEAHKQVNADIVILGGGWHPIKDWVFGSISHAVFRDTDASVLLVR